MEIRVTPTHGVDLAGRSAHRDDRLSASAAKRWPQVNVIEQAGSVIAETHIPFHGLQRTNLVCGFLDDYLRIELRPDSVRQWLFALVHTKRLTVDLGHCIDKTAAHASLDGHVLRVEVPRTDCGSPRARVQQGRAPRPDTAQREADPNYLAYLRDAPELAQAPPGSLVAYCDGHRVAIGEDADDLLAKIPPPFATRSLLIKEVHASTPRLDRPRRVLA
jgi:hypothetical protein